MKILTSLPSDKQFFDTYAPLSTKINGAGVFAQVVSGLTEIGIIFMGCKQALSPLHLGIWETIISVAVALVATATIEIGLRHTFPKAVDSILFRRWKGLHLPMSIFVWMLTIVLMATSGLLSFKNSSVIVDNFTPEATDKTTLDADSIFQAEKAAYVAAFRQDSAMIETTFKSRLDATAISFDAKIKSKHERIRGYESKEARTNKSYASRKDRVRQDIANLEATKADSLATLSMRKANELMTIKTANQERIAAIDQRHQTAVVKVSEGNTKAKADREAKVNNYGGGLGWFTIVCLFLFSSSVILDRIYRKGAGITESVQIESYDFRPSAWKEWIASIKERLNYLLHNKIKSFADTTPPAPLPAQPGSVYDLVEALQHVTIKLKLDTENEDGDKVIYLNAKEPETDTPTERRQIGFNKDNNAPSSCALYSPPTTNHKTTNKTPKANHETTNLREAKQRLKRYKKRLGSHQQKANIQLKNKGKICKRTNDAISNNEQWVKHYETLINELATNMN